MVWMCKQAAGWVKQVCSVATSADVVCLFVYVFLHVPKPIVGKQIAVIRVRLGYCEDFNEYVQW